MEKKRHEKQIEMENNLISLKSLLTLPKVDRDQQFKERNIKNDEECDQKIEELEIKLKIKQKVEKTDEEKYDLVDIEDHLLTHE